MAIFERALSKLTITAYAQHDDIKKNNSVGSFTAMYNPTQLDQTYAAVYSPNEAVSDANHGMRFERMGKAACLYPWFLTACCRAIWPLSPISYPSFVNCVEAKMAPREKHVT